MPITAQCPGCTSQFILQDQLAGQNVQCQQCQTVFAAPLVTDLPEESLKIDEFVDHSNSSSGLQQADAEETVAKSKHKTTYTAVKSRKKDDVTPMLAVGGVVTAAVSLVAGIIALCWSLFGGGSEEVADNGLNDGVNLNQPGDPINALTPELPGTPTNPGIEELKKQFEANFVTVNFTNVKGDAVRASRYLRYKLRDAAYYDYRLDSERAQQATEANRQTAEKNAIAGAAPYQHIVHYNYQKVPSSLPYPKIQQVVQSGTNYSYICGPCLNVQTFAKNVGMPNATISDRSITIKCDFKNGIPHPAVEKLIAQHSAASVAKVVISNAKGSEDLVSLFFEEMSPRKIDEFSARINVVGFEKVSSETYQFYAGPVEDVTLYASQFESEDWATVSNVDPNSRVISLQASLPSVLPTKDDFEALKKERWEVEKRERELKREKEQLEREIARQEKTAIDEADRVGKRRPKESTADWVQRSFTEKSAFYFDEFLDQLSRTPVEPDLLPTVSDYLVTTLEQNTTSFNSEKIFAAMLAWRTPDVDAALLEAVDNTIYRTKVSELMEVMEKIGTAEAAQKLSFALELRTDGDKAKKHLINMGEIAEPAVAPFMKHPDIQVRYRAYEVLFHVGTPASLPTLTENRAMEKNIEMKKNIKSVLDAINERYPEEEE